MFEHVSFGLDLRADSNLSLLLISEGREFYRIDHLKMDTCRSINPFTGTCQEAE